MSGRQSPGRDRNDATPADRPDPLTSDKAVERTAERSQQAAGPDGPSAAEVGDTFKRRPESRHSET